MKSLAQLTEVATLTLAGLPALTSLAGLEHLSKVSVLTLSRLDGLTSLADPTCEVRWLEARLEKLGTSVGYSETDNAGICP